MQKNSDKKNWVFFVPETIPSFAGTGRSAFNFADYLNTKSLNVSIVTLNRNLKLKSKEKVRNVRIIRISYIAFNTLTKTISFIYILPNYLYHILINDVIIIYSSHLIGYQLIIFLSDFFKKKSGIYKIIS